jgi:cobaltochelatase CobN
MNVALPEVDGRVLARAVSFKSAGAFDPLTESWRVVHEPTDDRVAFTTRLAAAWARLRRTPAPERRVALLLANYPPREGRIGNGVGLDTPASAVEVLRALEAAGYRLEVPFADGDALIRALQRGPTNRLDGRTEREARVRLPVERYETWFAGLPEAVREALTARWGAPMDDPHVSDGAFALSVLPLGGVVVGIQPARGYHVDPAEIYHSPDLVPPHGYLAFYLWLREVFGAHAVVHLAKHGNLEWLPGKALALSEACFPEVALGPVPHLYPFIVNDPGEGTQAKRRGHAVVVDHLVPLMARADTYGEMAKLEQLLDEYATVQAMDPAKLPALRTQIWEVVTAAQLHHDLHVDAAPDEDDFDDFILHIDGYLCEVKDVQIRDGLHVLGAPPRDEAQVNLVLSILRATQVWGGKRALPGLRSALAQWAGLDEQELLADPGAPRKESHFPRVSRNESGFPCGEGALDRLLTLAPGPAVTGADLVDVLEGAARALVAGLQDRSWAEPAAVCVELLGEEVPDVVAVLDFACREVVPRLERTTDEVAHVLHALDGGYVPAGPSGSPTRGLVNVLPTGRNFYSVDPKAIPSRSAWEVGSALAESLVARHLADTGTYPRSVGLTVWGTSAMRTQGDDLAEILALIGCRPVWDDASRRVTGVEVVPLAELGRPRIDVTVRISGFFRDAFPHVIALLDDAIRMVADLDEPAEENYLRAHVEEDVAEHGDRRRATSRIFGSKPGAYGAGLLPLIDARNWRSDADLAEVYAVWGGYAYGRGLDGREARADMEQSFRRIAVAAKNQDTREHDIVDSDDYFQYHGGMVAMVRALTGRSPAAYVGDSAVTDAVRTRSLAEETKRVFRARVVNPKWIAAMQRHGYKGAFELAATVDYLFGYDATAGVVDDWMYGQLAQSYVFDETNRAFMEKSNPWALRGITERLLEAADRGMWAKPDDAVLDRLRQTYLELEGDLEGGQS